MAKNRQLHVKVGDVELTGNTTRQIEALAETAGKLADHTPSEFKFGPFSFKSRESAFIWTGIVLGVSYVGYKAFRFFKGPKKLASAPPAIDVTDSSVEVKDEPQETVAPLTWGSFISKHSMAQLPDILANVLSRVPVGYEMAMLTFLLTAFGALCFSKVRAKYLDGKIHAPNLLLIIEGNWGAGKEKFNQLLHYLFREIINRDKSMISKDGAIIQYAGIYATSSKFIDIMANNQGVHMFSFSSEVLALIYAMKKANGLTFEHIRKAFDNAEVGRQNKSKKDIQGLFPVFMNAAFTGTPGDVNKFISKELEGGSASRFIWATIPDPGRVLESLDLPEDDEIKMMRGQVMEWNEKYCHKTINGIDVAAKEYHINLDYINDALNNWIEVTQYDNGRKDDPVRKGARGRMACIAFHAAIVLHMLYGEPTDTTTKQVIIDLTIHIADYCMERFLEKFGALQRALHVASNHKATNSSCNNYSGGLSKETVVAMYELYQSSPEMGYVRVGREFGLAGDSDKIKYTVKNAINKLKIERGL